MPTKKTRNSFEYWKTICLISMH